jgi:hypothetical protein
MNRRSFFSGLAVAALAGAMALMTPLVAEARSLDPVSTEVQFITSLLGGVGNDVTLYAVDGGLWCSIRCQSFGPDGSMTDAAAVVLDKAPGRLEAMTKIAIEHNRRVIERDGSPAIRRTTGPASV